MVLKYNNTYRIQYVVSSNIVIESLLYKNNSTLSFLSGRNINSSGYIGQGCNLLMFFLRVQNLQMGISVKESKT